MLQGRNDRYILVKDGAGELLTCCLSQSGWVMCLQDALISIDILQETLRWSDRLQPLGCRAILPPGYSRSRKKTFLDPKYPGSNMALYLNCYHLPNHLKDCLQYVDAKQDILSAK